MVVQEGDTELRGSAVVNDDYDSGEDGLYGSD
jgi:hypothetical protein